MRARQHLSKNDKDQLFQIRAMQPDGFSDFIHESARSIANKRDSKLKNGRAGTCTKLLSCLKCSTSCCQVNTGMLASALSPGFLQMDWSRLCTEAQLRAPLWNCFWPVLASVAGPVPVAWPAWLENLNAVACSRNVSVELLIANGCSFFLLPFFFLSLRGLRGETANLAAAACTQRGWHAPSYETSWKVPRSKTAARRKFSGRRRPGHDASPARLNYFISSLTGSKLYTIAQCTII